MISRGVRKGIAALVAATMLAGLSGCNLFGEPPVEEREQTIRVADASGYGEEYLRQQFTDLYEFAYPKTKIEFVQAVDDSYYRYNYDPNQKPVDPLEKLKEIMTGTNPPDLVKVSPEQLTALIEENLVTPVDPLAQRDQYDLNAIVPAIREGLKSLGDGKLYALAPLFTGSALMYNKKMFREAGVPFPKDGMTWDEIFDLARRVAKGEGKNRVYGMAIGRSGELFYDMNVYTAPLALNMVDDNAETMTVDSDEWEQIWKTLIKLQKEKVITGPVDYSQMNSTEPNPFFGDPFLSGKTAMMIAMNSDVNSVLDANKNASKIKGFQPMEWDVVTVPVHADNPGLGPMIYMDGIFAINTKAKNPDGAWSLLKFINGEEWSKLRSRSQYQMVSREAFIKPVQGATYNIKAFYSLTPTFEQNNDRLSQKYPNIYQVFDLGRQKMQLVIEGKKEARQALKEWQTEGNKLLKDVKAAGASGATPFISE